MIIRPSSKLATKLKVSVSQALPLSDNPLLDWSAHVFIVERRQQLLVTNTATLYSFLIHGVGVSNLETFQKRLLTNVRSTLERDGMLEAYERFIEPGRDQTRIAKTLNRSITGSMNDLVGHAKFWILECQLCNFEVPRHLNSIPLSALKYLKPREAMKTLLAKELDRTV